jgi:bifunctional non-homologous end joining protein LigD
MPLKSAAPPRKSAEEDVHGFRITHPDRVIYEEQGITKRDLANYYVSIADWMLPHLAGRPLSLVRCPGGMSGPCFYQKQPPQGLPKSVKRITIRFKERNAIGLYVEDLEGLMALVQFGVLELHAWQAHVDDIERPDRLVFDLDPGPDVPWDRVIEGAFVMRDLLKELSLTSFVKTTGGKGLHVVAPITRGPKWPEVKQFCKAVSNILVAADPNRYTLSMSKALRPGKIFVDYLRNERGATAVAPYSTRARSGAPVSMPLGWRELRKCPSPANFTIENAPRKVSKRNGDPWASLIETRQTITAAMKRTLKLK